ncbi:MAG: hypothetical protein HXS44_06660 [Theionarchaea archaeon]|nr:hypothetical protein [Theionarchaea archaeon]
MKLTLWRTKREKYLFFISLSFAVVVLVYAGFYDRSSRREDVDADGMDEVVKEIHLPNGGLVRTVIEEDGTMFMTQFAPSGEVMYKWKTVPPEKEGEESKNYVWDEKTKQWLPDQDMDGIPDTLEKPPG